MKTLIASDLQFAEQPLLSRRLETGITSRLADQVACFDWILSVARQQRCTRLIVLGDIFDSRTSIPIAVIDQVGRCFAKAAEQFDEVFVLVGNHDSALRHPGVNSLQAMRGLATVVETPRVYGELAFVPWIESQDDFRAAVGKVSRVRAARYLFSHVLIDGAVRKETGRALADLRPKRWRGVFLGDVHEPVNLGHGVQYVGAPMEHHYGDARGTRGVLVLDTVSNEQVYISNESSPRFHVVKERYQLASVKRGDFVRVQVEDDTDGHELTAAASKKTSQVENHSVGRTDEAPPRLAIATDQSHKTILKRYVRHRGLRGTPGLVQAGLDILNAAHQ